MTARICNIYIYTHIIKMSTDLKCSPREAGNCPIVGLCNCGHVHVATASGVDDINDFWLPFRRDLQQGIG